MGSLKLFRQPFCFFLLGAACRCYHSFQRIGGFTQCRHHNDQRPSARASMGSTARIRSGVAMDAPPNL
jgi:hypothetical protein